jgi:hypothetical protein
MRPDRHQECGVRVLTGVPEFKSIVQLVQEQAHQGMAVAGLMGTEIPVSIFRLSTLLETRVFLIPPTH